MDVVERIAAGLPRSVETLDADGPWETAELWLLARAYSRLRHRSRSPAERQGWTSLKHHCIRAAVAREPGLFIVGNPMAETRRGSGRSLRARPEGIAQPWKFTVRPLTSC